MWYSKIVLASDVGGISKQNLEIPLSRALQNILQELAQNGWRGLIVGGAVRDAVTGHVPKDIDVEVYHCNTAEAPIWMADLSFKNISEINVGDEVIGWSVEPKLDNNWGCRVVNCTRPKPETERGLRIPKLTKSTVLHTSARMADVVKVTLESGRIIRCTADHRWLHRPGCGNNDYKHTHPRNDPRWEIISRSEIYGPPEVGHVLAHVITPTKAISTDLLQAAGWLGGIYDGEGCNMTITQCIKHNPDVHQRIGDVLTLLGFDCTKLQSGKSGWRINNGRQGIVDLINISNPVRKNKLIKYVYGRLSAEPDRIIKVEQDGTELVYALKTTTGNYVAWGYASKNCDFSQLAAVLKQHGHVLGGAADENGGQVIGKAFGVIKFRDDEGNDYDFSLPRRDSKTGEGHTGFDVQVDPNMSPKEAASRRDFTFNSIAYDPLTNELHDYYGGKNDLENKILRATDMEKFGEDPLRVLRGMQLISRIGIKKCKKCHCMMQIKQENSTKTQNTLIDS